MYASLTMREDDGLEGAKHHSSLTKRNLEIMKKIVLFKCLYLLYVI